MARPADRDEFAAAETDLGRVDADDLEAGFARYDEFLSNCRVVLHGARVVPLPRCPRPERTPYIKELQVSYHSRGNRKGRGMDGISGSWTSGGGPGCPPVALNGPFAESSAPARPQYRIDDKPRLADRMTAAETMLRRLGIWAVRGAARPVHRLDRTMCKPAA